MATHSSALPLTRAGVIVRLERELSFLSAHAVRGFVQPPTLCDVPGTGLTMALVEGQVLAIIQVAARPSALIVCEVEGEPVGLLGADPEAVGFFEAEGSGVSYQGVHASALDLGELVRAAARRAAEAEVRS